MGGRVSSALRRLGFMTVDGVVLSLGSSAPPPRQMRVSSWTVLGRYFLHSHSEVWSWRESLSSEGFPGASVLVSLKEGCAACFGFVVCRCSTARPATRPTWNDGGGSLL